MVLVHPFWGLEEVRAVTLCEAVERDRKLGGLDNLGGLVAGICSRVLLR